MIEYVFMSEAFHGSMPLLANLSVSNGTVKAIVGSSEVNVAKYLEKAADRFMKEWRKKLPEKNFVFDYHVGHPALIGGSFAFRASDKKTYKDFWTERPLEVGLKSPTQAKADIEAFMFEGDLHKAA
jgi:hypothetical protein